MDSSPLNSTLALPAVDKVPQPFRDLTKESKDGANSCSGSKAEIRRSIWIWLVKTSRNNLLSAAMSSRGL